MPSLEYVKKIVYDKLKDHPDRWIHTNGVAQMAQHLAHIYNVDETKALIAAYMHDFSKYDKEEEVSSLLSEQDKEECQKYPVLYHSYGSAENYLRLVGNDKDIYNAIRNHVFGRLGMSKLEEIILISDYTEENRTYESCISCRKLLLDGKFNEAIYESTRYTIEFLKKKNVKPHPLQMEVLKDYKEKIGQ